MTYELLHGHDSVVMLGWSIFGVLTWLHLETTSEECEASLHLRWFLLMYILHWQGYVYFLRQHAYACSHNHSDPFLLPDIRYIVRNCLLTWIILFGVASNLIYTLLFAQTVFHCSMFELKFAVIYQWIQALALFLVVFKTRRLCAKIAHLLKILIKIFTRSYKARSLNRRLCLAKKAGSSSKGLDLYLDLAESITYFQDYHDWTLAFSLYRPLLMVDDLQSDPATSFDLFFFRRRLTRLLTTDPQQNCPFCEEKLRPLERIIFLPCCSLNCHWPCVRKRFCATGVCGWWCRGDTINKLKNDLTKQSAEQPALVADNLQHRYPTHRHHLQVPLLG